MRPNRDTVFTGTSSLGIPGNIEDLLRTSFATSLSVSERENQPEERQSTHFLIDSNTEDGGSRQPNRDTMFTSSSSQGVTGNFDSFLRTSLMTTASSASHMSNIIGDFPAPPAVDEVAVPSTHASQVSLPAVPTRSGPHLRRSSAGSTRLDDTET